jgi:hypothetical protein
LVTYEFVSELVDEKSKDTFVGDNKIQS